MGERAIVLGASMGGLLAARVLSDFFRNEVAQLAARAQEWSLEARLGFNHLTDVAMPWGMRVAASPPRRARMLAMTIVLAQGNPETDAS